MSKISFRRWYFKNIINAFKETWIVWGIIVTVLLISILSGFYIPDIWSADTFFEKSILGLLISLGVLIFILIILEVRIRILNHLEIAHALYEEEMNNKKTEAP